MLIMSMDCNINNQTLSALSLMSFFQESKLLPTSHDLRRYVNRQKNDGLPRACFI